MIKPISGTNVRKFALGAMLLGATAAGMSSCKPASKAEEISYAKPIPALYENNNYFSRAVGVGNNMQKYGTYMGTMLAKRQQDFRELGFVVTEVERMYSDDYPYLSGLDLHTTLDSKKALKQLLADDIKALCGADGKRIPTANDCINYIDKQMFDNVSMGKFQTYLEKCAAFEKAQGYETSLTKANLIAYKQMQLDSVIHTKLFIKRLQKFDKDLSMPQFIFDECDENYKKICDRIRPKPLVDPKGRGNFLQQIRDWFKSVL